MQESHIERGEAAELRGDLVTAAFEFELVCSDPAPGIAAQGWLGRARVAWRQARFPIAHAAIDRARACALEAQDEELRARIENGAGAIHYAQGAYAQAEAFYHIARGLTSNATFRAKIDLNLGVLANIEGDHERARGLYERARRAFQAAGDSANEALALHNVAMLFADEERWNDADDAYRASLALFEQQGNRAMIGSVALNRAEVLSARGQLDEAILSAETALAISTEIGDEGGRGEALRWRGHARRRLGDAESAERDLHESIRIAASLPSPLLEAEATEELGRLFVERADLERGRHALRRALELYKSLGAQRAIQRLSALMTS
jgi:tetratricopeptide (TPR) repeat protein